MTEVEREQHRHAIRMAHTVITTGHVVLALLDVEQRLAAAGLALPTALAQRNTAARRLTQHGLTYQRAYEHVVFAGDNVELASPQHLAATTVADS